MIDQTNNPPVAVAEPAPNGDAEVRRLLEGIAREERKLRRRKAATITYWVLAALLLGTAWSSSLWPVSQEVRAAVYLSTGIMFYALLVLAVLSTILMVLQSRAVGQQRILATLREMNDKLAQLIEAQSKG
ncbi:MAG: hypothetical protein MUP47_09660 [Phycisphaerae bacterium]|nr:hypothetical protein [Phycisphaerae bacterium]